MLAEAPSLPSSRPMMATGLPSNRKPKSLEPAVVAYQVTTASIVVPGPTARESSRLRAGSRSSAVSSQSSIRPTIFPGSRLRDRRRAPTHREVTREVTASAVAGGSARPWASPPRIPGPRPPSDLVSPQRSGLPTHLQAMRSFGPRWGQSVRTRTLSCVGKGLSADIPTRAGGVGLVSRAATAGRRSTQPGNSPGSTRDFPDPIRT